MFQSVVCAVDFSAHSRGALRWAAALTSRQGRLTAVHVVDPLIAQAARTAYQLDIVRDDIEPALRETVREALPAAVWRPEAQVVGRVGEAAVCILAEAGERQADLIVVGTQGLGGWRKWFLGSTTERVLRAARVPVLAVPLMDLDLLDLRAEGPSFGLRRVLVAVDVSDPSRAAVRLGADLARMLGLSLTLGHIVPPLDVPHGSRVPGELDAQRLAAARQPLEALAGELQDVSASIAVRTGDVASGLADLTTEAGPSLVVLGLGTTAGSASPRPGTVAYRLLCTAKVPVLAVPENTQKRVE